MNFIQALDAKQARENDAIHAPDCAMGTANGKPLHHCGGTYVCPWCDRKFGWCIGAFDDTPALCDECANVIQAVGE